MGDRMIIIIYGPAGSGKGTQSALIAKNLGIVHFSMGEALRDEIKRNTPIGKKIKDTVNSGKLVPAEITNKIILGIKSKKGAVWDGYPRDSAQLEFVKKNFKIDYVFELAISDKEVIRRMSSRRVCPKCGRNYNTIWLKPKIAGKCDHDKEPLVHRDDDKPSQIKKRLEIYHKDTYSLREYYKKIGVLHVIDASGSIEEVNREIMAILNDKE